MLALEEADDQADDDGNKNGEDGDRRVLPAQECGRTDEDAAGDVLHGRGAGVPRQNVSGEPGRENDGRYATDEDRQRIQLPRFQDPLLLPSRRTLAREHQPSSLGSPARHRSFSHIRNNRGQHAPAAVVRPPGTECATPRYTRMTSLPRGKSAEKSGYGYSGRR